MSKASKIEILKDLISTAEASLSSAKQILLEISGGKSSPDYVAMAKTVDDNEEGDNIVEGVFDGEKMIHKDGTEYPVPANYASKSKLVPGDTLKLTITENGTFLYKQIGPAERKRIIGTLTFEDGQYKVIGEGKTYKVLLASVTYFRGEIGDKVTLVVPADHDSEWGAIENVLPHEASSTINQY
ncbi:hypothetical protein CVV38_04185 [Candidatus Peregrinibacteria bacterium HGW-Peregrinibacteria-1]|jgi:hypothetical protein|nr:MAG: hypothetical protein CVV38_04185 [Candidatus Peregrinibacteria bacterium HGW-Peregrinibacteria-1]